MKKFLLLFSAVLFGFANAFAQAEWADPQSHDDVVTDISQLSNNKVYSIIPEDWYHPTQDGEYLRPNGLYGVLFARSTGDRLESAGGWGNCVDNQDPRKEPYAGWQTQAKAIQKDSYDPQQQFAIINYEGKYYLWAVAAKKFAAVHDMSALGYSSRDNIIDDVIAYIDHNYKTNITLETIAPLFGYNSSYLGKIFSKKLGQNFNTYLDTLRVEKAKEILTTTKAPVYKVAEMVGYKNVDYFHIKFKKYTGSSPAEYRKLSE